MKLVILNHPFRYETEKLAREFFPDGIEITEAVSGEKEIVTGLDKNEVFVSFDSLEKRADISALYEKNDIERVMAQLLFSVLGEKTGYFPAWGILTGIRPSKVMRNYLSALGEQGARAYFENELFVSKKKTELALEVAKREQKIIDLSRKNSFSLYISIPFCPTRCSYCSFISHSFESVKKLIPEYVEKLIEEIRLTGSIAKQLGLKSETVYLGGGTPTTLSADDLGRITDAVGESFDLDYCREYTVEAGRPDTVTAAKLDVLKRSGVTRISINPQSFDDGVLRAIGRRHTGEQTEKSFVLAREKGFDNINMDLIAGLPEDTLEGFENTLEKTLSLSPENVTVHTLSIKRSSFMSGDADYGRARLAEQMLSAAERKLKGLYSPYYMYRQSKTLGNLENVGWCKDGFEGLYNIFMMEEIHPIFSCGAGAVTKLRSENGDIERVFNFKYPFEYIKDYAEITERKKRITDFYNSYNY